MYTILSKQTIAKDTIFFSIECPEIAKKRKAGQFVIIRVHDEGERIPFTIVDSNIKKGTIDIIIKQVGESTQKLMQLKEGESFHDVAGPLGNPTHIENFGNCVVVGGGVGIAALYPIACALKQAGNTIITVLGARSQDYLFYEDQFSAISDKIISVTDDGSNGSKGFVTDALQDVIDKREEIDFVLAVGPLVMMEAVSNLTKEYKIPTMVSLNPIMVDGTGMCGACRCVVDGETKFACVDGPEFDGHKVDFENLKRRLQMFDSIERHRIGEEGCNLRDKGNKKE